MPVPIEAIVEQTYGLKIEWGSIEEPSGTKILGALYPTDMTIVLNDRHEAMFDSWVGPYEFTLAHELGHWIYDSDPHQGDLFDTQREEFCHWRHTPGLPVNLQRRETNANKLAAAVLMPADLIRTADIEDVAAHVREYAARWGVSRRALEIRLSELDLVVDDRGDDQFDW